MIAGVSDGESFGGKPLHIGSAIHGRHLFLERRRQVGLQLTKQGTLRIPRRTTGDRRQQKIENPMVFLNALLIAGDRRVVVGATEAGRADTSRSS